VQAAFGHEEIQSFPISLGLNNKGGMDNVDFFERRTRARKVGRYQM
jgi:hypothetical protein